VFAVVFSFVWGEFVAAGALNCFLVERKVVEWDFFTINS